MACNGDFWNVTQSCFVQDENTNPCDTAPCQLSIPEGGSCNEFELKLCAHLHYTGNASIWEVRASQFEDYGRLEGAFHQDAKDQFDEMQRDDDIDQQMTFVSVVGRRGTGKSTIGAFLSGNSTMFEVSECELATRPKWQFFNLDREI